MRQVHFDPLQSIETEERNIGYRAGTKHGPITGTGPGFDEAMRKFKERQRTRKRVGKWRAVSAAWAHDDGDYIDVDYYIVNWDGLL